MRRLSYFAASIGAFKGWLYSAPEDAALGSRFVDALHDLSELSTGYESDLFGGCAPLFVDEWTAVEWKRVG